MSLSRSFWTLCDLQFPDEHMTSLVARVTANGG